MESSDKNKHNSGSLNAGLLGQYRRFAFILSVNGNKICQRRFNINRYNKEGLRSAEFYDVLHQIVTDIKQDLVAKSRTYLYYVSDLPLKLTGFVGSVRDEIAKLGELEKEDSDTLAFNLTSILANPKVRGDVDFYGLKYRKTYMDHVVDMSRLNDTTSAGPCVFRFQFLYDNSVIFDTQWDGTIYPRYVRNSVDITNSDEAYAGKDPDKLSFTEMMIFHLNNGREDIAKNAVKAIIDVLDAGQNRPEDYTRTDGYGDRDYSYSSYNRVYVKGWREAVAGKTRAYERNSWAELSPGVLRFIDQHL